jgi:hypothetical protein
VRTAIPAVPVCDPLLHEIDLPLTAALFPLGFPMRLATNSPEVLSMARRMWAPFPELFPEPPIHLRVLVTSARGQAAPAPQPVFRAQGHLLAIAAGHEDFAVADLAAGFCFASLTPATIADEPRLRSTFFETLVYSTLNNLHLTSVHAACVALGGRAALLCGPTGAGKSTLAYVCARRGFTFLSDDVSSFLRRGSGRTVIGRPAHVRFRPDAGELFPELRGRAAGIAANGKPTIDVSLEGQVAAGFSAEVAGLFFLNRGRDLDTAIAPMTRHEAWNRLAAEIPVLERHTWEKQIASLDALLQAETYELRYTEAAGAAALLEVFLNEGAAR